MYNTRLDPCHLGPLQCIYAYELWCFNVLPSWSKLTPHACHLVVSIDYSSLRICHSNMLHQCIWIATPWINVSHHLFIINDWIVLYGSMSIASTMPLNLFKFYIIVTIVWARLLNMTYELVRFENGECYLVCGEEGDIFGNSATSIL